MSVVLDDLPALMWHAELGRSLPDLWSGGRHRGAQVHDLRAAVTLWATRYGQRAWLRQLEPPAGRAMEDALLRTIARLDGTPFPSAARVASGWLRGRLPPARRGGRDAALETAYCAQVVAVTYQAMGLLPARRPANWYDPGRFWSGDDLRLSAGARLGGRAGAADPGGGGAAGAARPGAEAATGPRRRAGPPSGGLRAAHRRVRPRAGAGRPDHVPVAPSRAGRARPRRGDHRLHPVSGALGRASSRRCRTGCSRSASCR